MRTLTPSQAEAIQSPGNLLVSAGAGTGKTHVLVQRCVRLIRDERLALDRMLLITFTEAAAAEMRARIRQALESLHASRPHDEFIGQQLVLLDAANISTIHGFCLRLLKEFFHELNLDPQFVVLDETQARPLIEETLDELMERLFQERSPLTAAAREYIRDCCHGSERAFCDAVLNVYRFSRSLPRSDAWLQTQLNQASDPAPADWMRARASGLAKWISDWMERIRHCKDQADGFAVIANLLEDLKNQEEPEAIVGSLQALADVYADRSQWPKGKKTALQKPFQRFIEEAKRWMSMFPREGNADPLRQDWDWARPGLETILRSVQAFAKAYDFKKRELGGLDFSDLEQQTIRLLFDPEGQTPSHTALHLRERLRHVFVDEYQDINAVQDAIIQAITTPDPGPLSPEASAPSRDGSVSQTADPEIGAASSADDESRSLFLVGDVKQSIYRFRLADPRIFQRYHREWNSGLPGHARIDLKENFRSREPILDFVNSLFERVMLPAVGGVAFDRNARLEFAATESRSALRRRPESAPPSNPGFPRAELHVLLNAPAAEIPDASADEESVAAENETPDLNAMEREAMWIARRLSELKRAGHLVWDEKQAAFRPAEWSDMVILLRSPASKSETYAKIFAQLGVPLSARRHSFLNAQEVTDLLNLLKLLDNPIQDLPLLAVLRSPLAHFTERDLAELRIALPKKPLWRALQAADQNPGHFVHAKAARFLSHYNRWRRVIQLASLSMCLEAILEDTHYESLLEVEPNGTEKTANLRKLALLARTFDPYQRQGLYRFLQYVKIQRELDPRQDASSPSDAGAVRLLSIHASKGLEFPIVVVADLGKRFNLQSASDRILLDEISGLCPRIYPPRSSRGYPSIAHWMKSRRERRELLGEEMRLLYVALTRARDTLILVGGDVSPDKRLERLSANSVNREDAVARASACLDWLLLWLKTQTQSEDSVLPDSGELDCLRWEFHGAQAMEAPVETTAPRGLPSQSATQGALTSDALRVWTEQTKGLAGAYPFQDLTVLPAKSSLTELRRRMRENDEDAHAIVFRSQSQNETPEPDGDPNSLSAAEAGAAHHLFLQLMDLDRVATLLDIRNQAGQMEKTGVLSEAQARCLNLPSIHRFWNSEIGTLFRSHSPSAHRELPFTSRFSMADLRRLDLLPIPFETPSSEEFMIVQGIIDLAAILHDRLYLLDFKTDRIETDSQLKEKAELYRSQMTLYRMALERIYQRPVEKAWLYFLHPSESILMEEIEL